MNFTKNFGFIKGINNKEYFFHKDLFNGHWFDLYKDFQDGVIIKFEFDEDKDRGKGPRATNVKRTDWPNQG